MARYAVTFTDGSVWITTVVDDVSVEECIEKWPNRDQVARVTPIEEADIPSDRTFRNAWRHDGAFKVDMPAAREILRGKMRIAMARKQVKRDVTGDPAIEAARTPDELKAAWPRELLGDIPDKVQR